MKRTFRYRKIYEDEQVQQQQPQQQQPASSNSQNKADMQIKFAQSIAQLTADISRKEKEFNDYKANQMNKINQLRKQAADAGIDLSGSVSEGISFRYSKKLYESLISNKSDELAAAFKVTFDKLDNISYYPDNKVCLALARRLLAWINEQCWNDGTNHWPETEDKLRSLFTNGTMSMSRREINDVLAVFKDVLIQNTVFAWIFGNKLVRFSK